MAGRKKMSRKVELDLIADLYAAVGIPALRKAVDAVAAETNPCDAHTKTDGSWWEHDGRGIPLARVCGKCKRRKLAKYRPAVLRGGYSVEEPIEEE